MDGYAPLNVPPPDPDWNEEPAEERATSLIESSALLEFASDGSLVSVAVTPGKALEASTEDLGDSLLESRLAGDRYSEIKQATAIWPDGSVLVENVYTDTPISAASLKPLIEAGQKFASGIWGEADEKTSVSEVLIAVGISGSLVFEPPLQVRREDLDDESTTLRVLAAAKPHLPD